MITGGAGFIGSHFVDLVFEKGFEGDTWDEIHIVDSLTYAGDLRNIQSCLDAENVFFHKIDIGNRKELFDSLPKVDVIVNFAAESHVDNSLVEPSKTIHTNIVGTANLLDFALSRGINRFIQVSTDEVYGTISEGSWDESSPLKPRSPYSASKAAADLLAISYFVSFGLDVSITRSSNNFGPRQNHEKMIPTIIRSIIQDLPIPIYGNGENVRDWLYVEDNVEAIYQVMIKGRSGSIYNLGSRNELTNNQLVQLISKFFPEKQIKTSFVEDRRGHDFRYSLDSTLARHELGFEPRHNFEQSIEKTVDTYKEIYSISK